MRGGTGHICQDEQQLLAYAALTVAADAAVPLTLSPRVMQWSDQLWLVDLRLTRYYWAAQASRRGLKASALLQQVQPAASMVLAACPWQALLFSAHLHERSLPGLLELREPFSQALLRQVSWAVWFDLAKAYAAAAARVKVRRFNEEAFLKNLRHLEQAVLRLGQRHPVQLLGAGPQAFRRRFGEELARLWQWTFAGAAARPQPVQPQTLGFAEDEIFASGFPWQDFTLAEKPCVKRHLEHPVWSWEPLREALIADLDHLAGHPGLAGLAVVRLVWTLHLEDMSDCLVSIAFRHPHNLSSERGQQKTALMQAEYSFTNTYAQRAPEDADIVQVPLIGWSLIVEACLAKPSLASDLFGDGGEDPSAAAAERIDNQLPIALERYYATCDWILEDAFTTVPRPPVSTLEDPAARPWTAVAAKRPLYIYAQPRPLPAPPAKTQFIERTAEAWWRCRGGERLERNYFLIESRPGQRSWATQDEAGSWWVHGFFA